LAAECMEFLRRDEVVDRNGHFLIPSTANEREFPRIKGHTQSA
jgi:hypothetical protein